MRDRRHEPADLRRRYGSAVYGWRARGLLRAGSNEEESSRHVADGDRRARAAGADFRHHLSRDHHDRLAALRGCARVPGPGDRHRRHSCRGRPIQDRSTRRPRVECRPGIRGLRKAGRREESLRQGSAGARRLGVQVHPLVSRFYLTTAIDYVNSRPQLGTAYEKIAADVIARYKRLCGVETRFLMGNDEHSQNVFKKASEEGLDPLAYCDQMEQEFRRTWRRLDVSFDDFIRTTEPRHHAGVTELARRLYDAGDIYDGIYEGWYCVGCEEFKQEKDLVDGKCPLHPTLQPDWIREKNYFFRLSKYQQPLLD